jgi:hypothetical protein
MTATQQTDVLRNLVLFTIAPAILGTILALGALYLLPAIDPIIPWNSKRA